jgi:DNA-binding NtrC family response regulator
MQTVWVLLVQSGLLPARMIATVAPQFQPPNTPVWREVDLSLHDFPQVVSPDDLTQRLGVLQAQNENLAAQVQRLEAELAVARSGAGTDGTSELSVPPEFSLRRHLEDIERTYLLQALDQTGQNAAAAARLLGLDPAALRARAHTLGVRPRGGARRAKK